MHRLQSRNGFRLLFRFGKRRETQFFTLIYLPNNVSFSRFAFITPKIIDKRAVIRNRLRRRCREWIRTYPIIFPRPYDIAIMCKKNANQTTQKEFYADLVDLFGEYAQKRKIPQWPFGKNSHRRYYMLSKNFISGSRHTAQHDNDVSLPIRSFLFRLRHPITPSIWTDIGNCDICMAY